jgi:hypothetical protein
LLSPKPVTYKTHEKCRAHLLKKCRLLSHYLSVDVYVSVHRLLCTAKFNEVIVSSRW